MNEKNMKISEEALAAVIGGVTRTVYNDSCDYTNIRENPGFGGTVCFKANNGERVVTTGNTVEKDGYVWYEVHLERGSDDGWIAGSLIGY